MLMGRVPLNAANAAGLPYRALAFPTYLPYYLKKQKVVINKAKDGV
tara:strand:- start:5086 stop:5223 length:138 start_codon:yes stop_codon:yes gene_type:complete